MNMLMGTRVVVRRSSLLQDGLQDASYNLPRQGTAQKTIFARDGRRILYFYLFSYFFARGKKKDAYLQAMSNDIHIIFT